ncbi:MAG: response regulator [Candidatus Omnitrophica bacterium]|nr:response regulator [Candidatus Omnitrophota bacterium]
MPKKILVIDDEPVILTTLRDRLILDGYEVITAVDGNSGIEQAEKEKPDLIVLDIMLPDMDGHQVCRIIKGNKKSDAKIIIVTSKIDAIDAVRAKEAGADDFTVKTTGYAALVEAIKHFI